MGKTKVGLGYLNNTTTKKVTLRNDDKLKVVAFEYHTDNEQSKDVAKRVYSATICSGLYT